MTTEEYIFSIEAELDRLRALGCPVGLGSHVAATRQPHSVHAENDESNARYQAVTAAAQSLLGDTTADPDRLDMLVEAAISAAETDRKLECPDCPQWSVHGPGAESQLIGHWSLMHMRRVSVNADGSMAVWPSPADSPPG